MKRRAFLQTAAAAVATPALPAVAMSAPAANFTSHQLMWAEHYARVHNAVSPDLLSSALGFSRDVSKALCEKMFSTNVIGSPSAFGIAKATNPFYTQGALPGFRPASKGFEKIQKMVEKVTETVDQIIEEDTPDHPPNAAKPKNLD